MAKTATKTMATGAETGEIDALLGLDRVAEILSGISPRNVRNRIYGGELRSVKLGGRRLVRQSDLREYIERLGDE